MENGLVPRPSLRIAPRVRPPPRVERASLASARVAMPPRERPARAPIRPRPRPAAKPGVDAFTDEALLAELSDDDDGASEDAPGETMDALERRLRRELATMQDESAAEEAALMREIEATREEPDEADALMAQILAEERAERAAVASSVAASIASDVARLREECHAAKMEAVRLKRAGDMDGAREALRRSKALAARADAAAAAASADADAPTSVDRDAFERETPEALEEAIRAAKLEAVARKRAGDVESARAALREAKALAARRERLVSATPTATANATNASSASTGVRTDDLDLEALVAAAQMAVVSTLADDPDSLANRPAYDGEEADDDALLAAELGAGAVDDPHFGDEYDGLGPDGRLRDVDEATLARERAAELEGEVRAAKMEAVRLNRAGDADAARTELRRAKSLERELAEVKSLFAS